MLLDDIIAALETIQDALRAENFNQSEFINLVESTLDNFTYSEHESVTLAAEPAAPPDDTLPALDDATALDAASPEPAEAVAEPAPEPTPAPEYADAPDFDAPDLPASAGDLGDGANVSDLPQYDLKNIFIENFDNDLGAFRHNYGQVTWGSENGDGYLQVTSPADTHANASAMIATGNYGGNGDTDFDYGLYSFTMKMPVAKPGPYALLWGGKDTWKTEIDVVELGGTPGPTHNKPFGVSHVNNGDGRDNYIYKPMPNVVDPTELHTYSVDWSPDALTYYVDGHEWWKITDPDFVPKSFADGGEDVAPSFGQLTGWWPDQNPIDNYSRLYQFTYIPHGDIQLV